MDVAAPVQLAEMDFVKGMSPLVVDIIRGFLERKHFDWVNPTPSSWGIQETVCILSWPRRRHIVLPKTEGRRSVRSGDLRSGTFFGEIALLDGGPRTGDAVAVGKTEVLFLSTARFSDLRAAHPIVATHLMNNVGREVGFRLRLSNTRLQTAE